MADRGPLTCAGCALLCDDVELELSGPGSGSGPDVALTPECALGARWFSTRLRAAAGGPAAMIDGEPAEHDSALKRAAGLLRDARRPLLHGFAAATVEDMRAAVTLADRIGALVVTDPMGSGWPGAPAVPLRGDSTATLGEIRDRARLLIVWREDPESTHPRLLQRLAAQDRTLVVIDDRETATTRLADHHLRWPAPDDLGALQRLQLAQRGLADDRDGVLERLRTVPHAAVVYGPGLTAGAGGERRALALHELVRALAHERHVVSLALPATPGARTARDVLAWQTGYGSNVDLVCGHPELITASHAPGGDEGVDVSLSVQADVQADAQADTQAEAQTDAPVATDRATTIVIGGPAAPGAGVFIPTAPAAGTVHRLDGVPVPVQAPAGADGPTAAQVLVRLLAEVGR